MGRREPDNSPRNHDRAFPADAGMALEITVFEIFEVDLFGARKGKENHLLICEIEHKRSILGQHTFVESGRRCRDWRTEGRKNEDRGWKPSHHIEWPVTAGRIGQRAFIFHRFIRRPLQKTITGHDYTIARSNWFSIPTKQVYQ
jgi:hypothetical protein